MFQEHAWRQGKDQPWCSVVLINFNTFFVWLDSPSGPKFPHSWGFKITLRHTKHGRTPLSEWSTCCRDLYLHNRQHLQKTDLHAPGTTQTCNPSKRAAANPLLRPQTHKLDATLDTNIPTHDLSAGIVQRWAQSQVIVSQKFHIIFLANKNLFLRSV